MVVSQTTFHTFNSSVPAAVSARRCHVPRVACRVSRAIDGRTARHDTTYGIINDDIILVNHLRLRTRTEYSAAEDKGLRTIIEMFSLLIPFCVPTMAEIEASGYSTGRRLISKH